MSYKSESEIHEALIANVDKIGYPNVGTIRHAIFKPGAGAVDVAMFPAEGLHRLVLVEVKMATATDATDKVIGQLMKYYSNSLLLSIEGVEAYRKYAVANSEIARAKTRTKPNDVLNIPNPKAWNHLQQGRKLRPEEIALFVAFNGAVSPSLRQIITVLDVHHNLRIGAIRVDGDGSANVLVGAHLTERMQFQSTGTDPAQK